MFSDKSNRKSKSEFKEPGSNQNRINEGTTIKGDIDSKGFFRIDGTIEGNVTTPSKVVLGRNGTINGNLTCENADIEGTLIGNLKVTSLLTLRSSAVIEGDVAVGKLIVETGAVFNATCAMKEKEKTVKELTEIKSSNPFNRINRVKKPSPEQFN